MKRLFVFDMDGTLLPNTTAMVQIAKMTGHAELLDFLEKQYWKQEIDNMQFAKTIYDLWKEIASDIVEKAFHASPKMRNIEKVLQKLIPMGGVSCLITSSPEFFAHHFYQFGFEYIFASKPFNLVERKFTPEQILHAKDKPLIVHQLCQELDLPLEETVAFGDSLSDVPLFQKLEHTIAVNGDAHIKEYAKHHYSGIDLMEALMIAEPLMV
jgi:phosphoserine phosphatase